MNEERGSCIPCKDPLKSIYKEHLISLANDLDNISLSKAIENMIVFSRSIQKLMESKHE